MVEHELEAVEADVDNASPYLFQRIGELSFHSEGCKGSAAREVGSRQRECIATAPRHGLIAMASQRGKGAVVEHKKLVLQTCAVIQ